MPSDRMHEVAAIIRRLCEEKRFSYAELSRQTGISQPAMGRWFRGEVVPSLESRRLVARALGVPLSDLIVEGESTTDDATGRANEVALEHYLRSDEDLADLSETEQEQMRASLVWLPGDTTLTLNQARRLADLIRARLRKPAVFAEKVLNPKGTPPRKRRR